MAPVQQAWPVLFFWLGVFFGYATVRVGPIGVMVAVIALGVAVAARQRRTAVVGSYLAGLGLTGTLIGARSVFTSSPCGPEMSGISSEMVRSCYSPETLPAFAVYGVCLALGVVLLVASAFGHGGIRASTP